jgi:fatty-acyl-CoA synthase
VLESAVVGVSDPQWGEIPIAYVRTRPGAAVDPAALAAHVRARIAGFKTPREFIFTDLPKTSTGKIQKNLLRSRAAEHRNGSR